MTANARLGWLLLATLGAWVCMPLLAPGHVEVLSAQMEINAIAANEHRLADANLQYPIHVEYFYLSRIGVVYLLQVLMRWLGPGDLAFTLLTQLAFVAFFAACVAAAVRFGGTRPLAASAALLLTPGIPPLGFYYSDSTVSLAFAVVSLIALPRPQASRPMRIGRASLAGALFGAAALARVDAVLLLPLVGGLYWNESRRIRDGLGVAVWHGGAMLAVFVASGLLSGHSVIESVRIGNAFNALHAFARHPVVLVGVTALFFGPLNLALLPLGAVLVWKRRGPTAFVALVALPAASLGYFVGHAVQPRQFHPLLSPFVATLGGLALEAIVVRRGTLGTAGRRLFAAAVAVVWLAPPLYVPVMEGPRPVIGQLWAPLLWHQWHRAISDILDDADREVDAAESQQRPVGVVALEGNPDAFLRLRLWQRGFRPIPVAEAAPGCSGALEAWARGPHRLLLARTENAHLMAREGDAYVLALLLQRALSCRALREGSPLFVAGERNRGSSELSLEIGRALLSLRSRELFFGHPGRIARPLADTGPLHRLWRIPTRYPVQQSVSVTTAQIEGLAAANEADLTALRAGSPVPLPDYDGLMREYEPRVWDPRRAR